MIIITSARARFAGEWGGRRQGGAAGEGGEMLYCNGYLII